ncbi:MAG: HrpB1 family type III secretion system apparatus protein [Pararobbsia sp.]
MDVQKDGLHCPSTVVGALIDLASSAFAHSGTPMEVEIENLEHLVEMLHLLRPDNVDFSFFDGWLRMLHKEWSEAEDIFRGLVERSVCMPASRGMLLQCLKARGDFGWKDEARTIVEEGGDKDVTRLAKLLLASDDLKDAAAAGRRTGRFVTPESARAVEEEEGDEAADNGAGATSSQLTSDMLLAMHYMRI